MTTAAISDVSVAWEGSFGNLAAASKLPTVAGITWYPLPVVRSNWVNAARQPEYALNLTRTSSHEFPGVPATTYNRTAGALWGASPGAPVQRWLGDITVEGPLWTIGDGTTISSYNLHPVVMTWLSSLEVDAPGGGLSDTVAVVGTANSHTATVAADYAIGRGIAAVINNALEFSLVSDIAGAVVTYSPAFSQALPNTADMVRHCYTLFPRLGTPTLSAMMRFNMNGRCYYAFGCRVKEVALQFDGETLTHRTTVEPTVILRDDTGAAPSAWTKPDGTPCQFKQSYHVMSAATSSGTVPASLARTPLSLHSWSATLRFGLSPVGGGHDSILGRSGTEVTSYSAEASVVSEPSSTLDNMKVSREERTLLLGCGPAGGRGVLEGWGCGLAIMAAHLAESPALDEGPEQRHVLNATFRAGRYALEDASADAANTEFRFLLPM